MIEVFDCEQGGPIWRAHRAGIPTASVFAEVLAKGEGKTRRKLMLTLLGERLTGEPAESYTNAHMERGKVMEAEARQMYAFIHGVEPKLVGFIRNGNTGCSPDSLIGDNGMLEIKTKLPHLQLECIFQDRLPPEHKAQVQGCLMVAERDYCDFVSYWPRLPLFVKRVYRDEEYIKTLRGEISRFCEEMAELEEKLK